MALEQKSINKEGLPKAWQRFVKKHNFKPPPLPRWLAYVFFGLGLLLLLLGGLVYYQSMVIESEHRALVRAAEGVHKDSETTVRRLQSILRSPSAIESARARVNKEIDYRTLLTALRETDKSIVDVRTFDADLLEKPVKSLANSIYPQEYVIYDMLLEADNSGTAAIQVLQDDGRNLVVGVTKLKDEKGDIGYLLVSWKAEEFFERIDAVGTVKGFLSLQQSAGASHFVSLESIGRAPEGWVGADRKAVRGSLFYISWSQPPLPGLESSKNAKLLLLLGLLIFVIGWLRKPEARVIDESTPELVADTKKQNELVLPDTEKQREAEEMASFNSQQLDVENPAPGAESEPELEPEPELYQELHQPTPVAKIPEVELHQRVKPVASIFKAYDIRGIVNETLTEDAAWFIGRAVGTVAVRREAGPVVVARDGRISGPVLTKALKRGMLSTGCDVIEIGMVPTGVLYYAAAEFGSGSGVMVTGSHNPPEYNGLKMVIGGVTLASEEIQNLYRMIAEDDFDDGVGVTRTEGVLSHYQERISTDIQLARPLKIVADCGNGVGGVNAVSVLQSIGAEVAALYDDVDGTFPNHHPDPSVPENLEDLIKAVKGTNADLGVAFDGDADRLGVVTPSGEIIYSDRLMILFVQDILSRNPGATIIYDVKCSRHLTDAIREAGGVPLMWKTGHSFIKNKMREMKSPFAGEMSGHFFFKERWYGVDDGIYAACRLLEILAWKNESPEEVLSALPHGVSTPELKVEMAEGENHTFVDLLQDRAHFDDAEINTIDGLRVDFDDGWGLVRASNTTPILVLRFDADTEEALHRIQNAFRDLIMSLRPDLELPF
ncbi:MAG: phosphomannomutase/phosphoglucomutase [Xanthomonadales bacterium]|nr:phosphomannomutase/phosphoglucomutase [Xanthomonadales bacterium]